MLERLFESGDRKVAGVSAWLQRLGLSGVVVLALMAYGTYGAVDLVRFVLR
jgi:hypothetical protein